MMPSKRPFAGFSPAISFIFAMTLRSIPPAKSGFPEVMTIPFTASSARAASTSLSSSSTPSRVSTFIDLPSKSQTMVATPSASVVEVKMLMSGLRPAAPHRGCRLSV